MLLKKIIVIVFFLSSRPNDSNFFFDNPKDRHCPLFIEFFSGFKYSRSGYAGLPSDTVYPFQRILYESPTPTLDFEYMMSSENLDVQLYGLMGLYWVNPSRFAELISQYRSKTQTSMKYFSGCSEYRQSVAITAIDISEYLAFSYAITFTEYDDLMLELDLSQIETETIVRMQERLPPALDFCI